MPRATIWITEENFPLWQDIENKSAWINMMLRLAEADLIEIEGVNDGTSKSTDTGNSEK